MVSSSAGHPGREKADVRSHKHYGVNMLAHGMAKSVVSSDGWQFSYRYCATTYIDSSGREMRIPTSFIFVPGCNLMVISAIAIRTWTHADISDAEQHQILNNARRAMEWMRWNVAILYLNRGTFYF